MPVLGSTAVFFSEKSHVILEQSSAAHVHFVKLILCYGKYFSYIRRLDRPTSISAAHVLNKRESMEGLS